MSTRKPKVEIALDPNNDTTLIGVFELWQAGLIPISESVLRKMIQTGEWKCGTLGRRYVTTGRQHHENVLKCTGRAAGIAA